MQLLFYPGCAAHQDTPSHATYSRGLVLEEPAISWFFGHYVQSRAEREDWRFAPLHAPDVEGVAPAWIGLAECDPLVDEGVDYADKLRASGVAVDLDRVPVKYEGLDGTELAISESQERMAVVVSPEGEEKFLALA